METHMETHIYTPDLRSICLRMLVVVKKVLFPTDKSILTRVFVNGWIQGRQISRK